MKDLKTFAFLSLLGLLAVSGLPDTGLSQPTQEQLTEFNQKRISLNTRAMYVLSGWALTNIAVGSIGYFNSSGETKYLHQMNVAWNVVNLAIAGGAIYQYLHANPTAFTFQQSLAEAQNIEKILLLNIGLNVSYMAAGGYLWERGIRKNSERQQGYGQSLLIQGGFLLLFDSTLYLLNHSHNQQLQAILDNVRFTGNHLSVIIPF